jgi:hypothetical protein
MRRIVYLTLCLTFSLNMRFSQAQGNTADECNLAIMFYSNRNSEPGIYSMQPDGADIQQLITLDEIMPDREFGSFTPSPDGQMAAVSLYRVVQGQGTVTIDSDQIYLVNLSEREVTLLFEDARDPIWSPDGTKLAFLSSDWEDHTIFIYDFASMQHSTVDPAINAPLALLEDWSPDNK